MLLPHLSHETISIMHYPANWNSRHPRHWRHLTFPQRQSRQKPHIYIYKCIPNKHLDLDLSNTLAIVTGETRWLMMLSVGHSGRADWGLLRCRGARLRIMHTIAYIYTHLYWLVICYHSSSSSLPFGKGVCLYSCAYLQNRPQTAIYFHKNH